MMAARSSTTILGCGGSAKAVASRKARESERKDQGLFHRLVSRGCTEVDDLGSVIRCFDIGQAEVDLDRAEG